MAAFGAADKQAKFTTGRDLARCGRMLAKGGHVVAGSPHPIDPHRLSVEQAANLLSAAAKHRVPAEQIALDVEAGAPTNTDGTLNLVHYAAWLVQQMGRNAGGEHGN